MEIGRGRCRPRKQHNSMSMKAPSAHDGIERWEGWEYQDLVIPVTLFVRHWRHADYVGVAAPRVQPIILAALEEAACAGWRADEPTDFATLFSRSRVRTQDSLLRWRISSVAIRLSRRVSDRQYVPHG
jgi:hypothetical protein